MPKLREIILIVIAILCAASAVHGYLNPRLETQTVYVEVEVPKDVVRVEIREILVDRVVVKWKTEIIKVLPELPASIKDDDAKQITAVGDIEPYAGHTRVVAVFDTDTGVTSLTSRRKSLPFFAFMNEKALGARWGFTGDGMGFDLYGRWTLVRVASVFGSLYAEGNSSSQFKAMVAAEGRF